MMNKLCPSCGCWGLKEFAFPDVYVCEGCYQVWTEKGLEAAYSTMKQDNKKLIEIRKFKLAGELPKYIDFGHRHLEKEGSKGEVNGKEHRFIIPVDLLSITLPADLVKEIESIQIVYQRKGVGDGA